MTNALMLTAVREMPRRGETSPEKHVNKMKDIPEYIAKHYCNDDFVEIGFGRMDIQKIIDTALELGSVEYIILEQDATKLNQLESIKRSMEGFHKFDGISWE